MLSLVEETSRGRVTGHFNPELEVVVAGLMLDARAVVRIEGHANATGPENFNQLLSVRRALAVELYLRRRGVTASQIEQVIGRGTAAPVTPENPESPANRAVSFIRVNVE